MWIIVAVMNATKVLAQRKPEKIQSCVWFKPMRTEICSGFLYAAALALFIIARIIYICIYLIHSAISDLHILIFVYFITHRLITNQQNGQLLVGLLAQFVNIAEVDGFECRTIFPEIFSGSVLATALVAFITVMIVHTFI